MNIPITPEDAICHPERSEGSLSNIEIPRYARNDSVRILKSNGYSTDKCGYKYFSRKLATTFSCLLVY
jgi:hypothetical protein